MNNENFKIPLVIGITGHRDIHSMHICELEKRVKDIFVSLIKKYPSTPLILLTPLADGADRIAAKVAFDSEFQDKITVSAVLPMDEKNYKETMGKGLNHNRQNEESSIEDFEGYLGFIRKQENDYVPKQIAMIFNKKLYENLDEERIDEHFYEKHFSKYIKLPNTFDEFLKIIEVEKKKKSSVTKTSYIKQQIRREQYTIVGEYIAIHSHILIAMHDKFAVEKQGGTSEIVRKKITGKYEHFIVDKNDVNYEEKGVVYSIITRKDDNPHCDQYKIEKYLPDGRIHDFETNIKPQDDGLIKKFKKKVFQGYESADSTSIYTKNHIKLNCFNEDVNKHIDNIKTAFIKDKLKCKNEDVKLLNKNLMIRRSAAYLADRVFKVSMENIESKISILLFFIVMILVLKSNYGKFTYSNFYDPIYILMIGIFYLLYKVFKSLKEKQEDYRAISEAMRIQTAWNMANINESSALYYLSHQKNELGWIRNSVRCMNIFYIPKTNEDKYTNSLINTYWINPQIDYFTKKEKVYIQKENKINNKINNFFKSFLIFSIIFYLLSLTSVKEQIEFNALGFSWIDWLNLIFVGSSLSITTYLKSKQLFQGNIELIKEYKLSKDIFSKAKYLAENSTNKDQQNIYKNLGIEALRENSSWLISRRTKNYNTPS